MSALNEQVGGSHYKNFAIQPAEFIHKNGIGFIPGNVIKYVCRFKEKNGIEDLKKARHYLDMLIEMEEKCKVDNAPIENGCTTCKHRRESIFSEPCSSCILFTDKTKWEPKDTLKDVSATQSKVPNKPTEYYLLIDVW